MNKKRLAALFLSVCMVMGSYPSSVYANSVEQPDELYSTEYVEEDVLLADSDDYMSEEYDADSTNMQQDILLDDFSEFGHEESDLIEEGTPEDFQEDDIIKTDVLSEDITEGEDELSENQISLEESGYQEVSEMIEFDRSIDVDGVKISVKAEPGVFPEDAVLSAETVSDTQQKVVDAAVNEVREEDQIVAASYTFDIKVINAETGYEYQPDKDQSVSVSFILHEVADENLETQVYHITEDESTGELTAESLNVNTEITLETGDDTTAVVETDSFSIYTVEFTYNDLQYVLSGDASIPMSEILTTLGLTGEVTNVEISNSSIFSASNKTGEWVVTTHQPFFTTEWMKVMINGVMYKITVTDDNNFQYTIESDGAATITKYSGGDSAIVIPSQIDGYTVTKIGNSAFSGCYSLKNVTLPESITSIGSFAFQGTGISYIKIPKNVTSLRDYGPVDESAFTGCEQLETIEFEEGINEIPRYGVTGVTSLKKVILPSTVEKINEGAFYENENLKEIALPTGLNVIDASAFFGCSSLEVIELPLTLESIGSNCYGNCKKLNAIRIPKKTNSIASNAFDDCDKTILVIYGYAKSYAETYANDNGITFVALEDEGVVRGEGFDLTKDGHCVINASDCFSYNDWTNWFGLSGYKIPLERYQEVFGEKYTKQIYDQNISTWGGNCFGMSATAAMFYLGSLQVVNYTHDVGVLAAGGYDEYASDGGRSYVKLKKSSELTKLIERYQIWQESNECFQAKMKYYWSHFGRPDRDDNSFIVETVKNNKEPIMILVWWNDPQKGQVGHAMLADSSREPEDIGNGWYRVYLYDPNNPYFEHFGERNPKSCYLQAENRFIELNTSNGQWRMAATVNGDGASTASIGYDSNGSLIPGSSMCVMSARDIPSSFTGKATFNSTDGTEISYACDDFSIKTTSGKLLYQKEEGKTTYIDDSVVRDDYVAYSENASTGVAVGKLKFPNGEYVTEIKSGYISYSYDGDYAGVVAKNKTEVRNVSSTELEIYSENSEPVNVVIEDVTGNDYVSVKTDICTDEKPGKVSVDGQELTIVTDKDQTVDVEVISNEEEKNITDIEVKKDTELSVDMSDTNSHIHEYDNWKVIKVPTCSNDGVEERVCINCQKKETRPIPKTNKHAWGDWKVTKTATALTTGEKARVCNSCEKKEVKVIAKLKATYKVNASSIKLKVGQSTKKVSISGLAKGDFIKTWSSSNKKIVTVTKKGVIRGKKVGKVSVTATLASGEKITIKVAVQKKAVATTKIGGLSKKITVKKGAKKTLKPVLYPITSVEKITYKSSNKKIATVSSKGVIKGKKAGKAKITVKAGKKKFVITVTVKK